MDFPPEGSVLGLWSREEHRSSRSGELVCRKCRQKYDPRYKSEFKDWEFLRQFSGWEVDYITLGWYIYNYDDIFVQYIYVYTWYYMYLWISYTFEIYIIYIRNYGKDVSPHPMGSLMDHLHFLVKVVEPTFWDIHVLPKMDISVWEKSVVYGLEIRSWQLVGHQTQFESYSQNYITTFGLVAVGFVLRQIGLYLWSLLVQSKNYWRALFAESGCCWKSQNWWQGLRIDLDKCLFYNVLTYNLLWYVYIQYIIIYIYMIY